MVLMGQIFIVKENGGREIFDEGKLHHSLVQAGAEENTADEIVKKIVGTLVDGALTAEIYKEAFEILHSSHTKAARRYSLRRSVMNLGPTGFPFEDYVGEILRRKGFEVKTRQMVLGECVPHEIDVVAWNEKELIMAEAKFHNELGVKSDLKVVLYVKARIDDLDETVFHYGFDRKLTEGWLITNTKFTTTAIHYAECKKLKLVGWNYPEKGNLHDFIMETNAVPVTSIGSLDQFQKQTLLSQGVILCDTIASDPLILDTLSLPEDKKEMVLHEIKDLQ